MRWLTAIFLLAAVGTGWLAFGGNVRDATLWVDAVFILCVGCFLICFLALLSRQLKHIS